MQKLLLTLFFFSAFSLLYAQDFDVYFLDKTIRINYLHFGNASEEKIEIKDFYAGGYWTGTRKHLNNPPKYGNILFEVLDSVTNRLLFAKTYSTLFDEYKTIEEAENKIAYFEECINMPYPKKTVLLKFTSISRKLEYVEKLTAYFNPNTAKIHPFQKTFETIELYIGGKSENCLDILFIPDGYTMRDSVELNKDLHRFANYIMECSPYKEHKKYVNIRAIKGFSEESGISDPNKNEYRKTLLNSSYNVLNLDRYLMVLNVWQMYDIADDAPFDAIVILCNSPKYGGGGIYNFYATVNNNHDASNYVIVHELGHSIAGLGDEYYTSEVSVREFYPEGIEPMEPNLTTLTDFEKKWQNMLPKNIPIPTPEDAKYDTKLGVFEGGGYVKKGVYRPFMHCTMKEIIYNNFCQVCKKALIDTFEYYAE